MPAQLSPSGAHRAPPAPLSARRVRRGEAAEEKSKVCEQYREARGAPEPSARGPPPPPPPPPTLASRGSARRGRAARAHGGRRLAAAPPSPRRPRPGPQPRGDLVPAGADERKGKGGKRRAVTGPAPGRAPRPAPPLLCMRKRSSGPPAPAAAPRPRAARPPVRPSRRSFALCAGLRLGLAPPPRLRPVSRGAPGLVPRSPRTPGLLGVRSPAGGGGGLVRGRGWGRVAPGFYGGSRAEGAFKARWDLRFMASAIKWPLRL